MEFELQNSLQQSNTQCRVVVEKLKEIRRSMSHAINEHDERCTTMRTVKQTHFLMSSSEINAAKERHHDTLWESYENGKERVQEYMEELRDLKRSLERKIRRQSRAFQDISRQRDEKIHEEYARELEKLDEQIEFQQNELQSLETQLNEIDTASCDVEFEEIENSISELDRDIEIQRSQYGAAKNMLSGLKNQQSAEPETEISTLIDEKASLDQEVHELEESLKRLSTTPDSQSAAVEEQGDISKSIASFKTRALTLLRLLATTSEIGTLMTRLFTMLWDVPDVHAIHHEDFMRTCANRETAEAAITQLGNLGILRYDSTSSVIALC